MSMRKIGCLLSIAAIVSTAAEPVMAQCAMATQMQAAQQAEQARRLANINTNMQTLTLLNQLETACLQGFQAIPTQYIGNSTVAMAALSKIEQAACQSLANQARSTAQSAMASAQAQVQAQINSIAANVSKGSGSTGMLSGVTSSSASSSSGWGSTVMNAMSRMFQ
ncbi:hypothetical protein [Trinickia acidisoli]|uniref:hypothetical protein n=1 Tax=Trinickia acidisoli TaxID=2767482 RepID=UPI001A8F23AF|nr:hypothetical protein [Trinickia acidisoli]